MKLNKTLLLTLLALPMTACAADDGLLSNYGSNRPVWLNKLQQLNNTSDGKFRIIQVGDSHTAGDYFTDRLRRRLQQQWGNGGIGWVYPNTVKGQRMATVRYSGSGWNTISSRKSHSDFSFGGIEARADGGSVTLSAADGSMDMQQISIFGKPVWSEQTLIVNGREIPAKQNGWQLLHTNASLPITLSNSMPWQIGFINIERPGRGVTVSAMGINGAQLSQWSKWRPGMWEDLAQTKADLIILAYGTNEAFSGNLDISSTERTWRNYIRQIKNTLPNAGILILGAPESLKTAYGSCGNRPVLLSEVQQMQQRIARDEKIMFWSWQDAMGGACSMKNWMAQGLAAKDGVHFSAQGYETAADKLADSLIRFAQ
ncbi:MAG: hypothetical protein HXM78_03120 [Neisseria lactamica]|nr:hypothetical protein [Neisseria lactamica]